MTASAIVQIDAQEHARNISPGEFAAIRAVLVAVSRQMQCEGRHGLWVFLPIRLGKAAKSGGYKSHPSKV
jgi:hypothetical protein